MGNLDDLGENLGQNLQEQLDSEKLEYNKNISLRKRTGILGYLYPR